MASSEVRYPWPPLPSADPQQVADDIARVLQDRWDLIEAQRLRVLESVEELARARALARLREMEAAVAAFQAAVEDEAERFVALVAGEYGAGVTTAAASLGATVKWTTAHRTAVASLASDSYADLLLRSEQAGRTSAAFARAVRAAARSTLMRQATGSTAVQAGRDLRKALEAQGISSVVYRDGSQHSVANYTQMAARTKGRVAFNDGSLREYRNLEVTYVEVFDGPLCGWASHYDVEKANMSIRPIDEVLGNLIAHPNCRRSFGPRPDVTNAKEAETAEPFGTAAQEEQQRLADRLRTAPAPVPKAVADGAARRERLEAARAARYAG